MYNYIAMATFHWHLSEWKRISHVWLALPQPLKETNQNTINSRVFFSSDIYKLIWRAQGDVYMTNSFSLLRKYFFLWLVSFIICFKVTKVYWVLFGDETWVTSKEINSNQPDSKNREISVWNFLSGKIVGTDS